VAGRGVRLRRLPLRDPGVLSELFGDVAEMGLKRSEPTWHRFPSPGGVTGMWRQRVASEIHSFPEFGSACLISSAAASARRSTGERGSRPARRDARPGQRASPALSNPE